MSSREPQRGRPRRAPRRGVPLTPGRVVAVASLVVVGVAAVMIVVNSGAGSHHGTSTATAPPAHSRTIPSKSLTTATQGTATVPVLVYHVINSQPAGSSASSALYVPAAEFSSQMQALKADGWHAVTLNQVEANWTHGTSLGAGKPIVITFDNGYASHYTNALPVLKGLGWVGVENLQLNGLPSSEGGLADAQTRGLIAAGWELDTQGTNHVDLTTLDPTRLQDDLATARQTLHTRYGVPVNWFSYPSGDYNPAVVSAVRAAGYLGAMSVNPGWAGPKQDRFRLPRLVVMGGTTPSQLLGQINSAQRNTSIPSTSSGAGLA
jgi:peptidoglycan/xylan/chitin deacetylase (PgdA/CDA1 family)